MLPDIVRFGEEGVVCTDGTQHAFDQVILATGYKAKVENFIEDIGPFLDRYGVPRAPVGEGPFEGLYFVGFDNYKLGGILGTIFTDSETVANSIREKSSSPGDRLTSLAVPIRSAPRFHRWSAPRLI